MELDSYEESDFIVDEYNHLNPGIYYSVTRVPGKGVSECQFQYLSSGCHCSDSHCTKENNCSCLKYGANYRFTENVLVLENDKFGNVPVFECNLQCSCFRNLKNDKQLMNLKNTPKICSNRNVQFGPIDGLEIFDAGAKGLGLKTRKKILSGTFICEYAGEVISLEEAKKRQKNALLNGGMNYIFILREYMKDGACNFTCVDPTHVGNIGRYINHSCQPNSAIVPVRVNNAIPWLCIFAIKDIEKDEEISYDYSGGHSLDNMLEEGEKGEKKPCYCGTVACKQYIPFEAKI